MRAIFTLILLIAGIVAILVLTGIININQTEEATLPEVSVEEGTMPEFEVDTPEIELGTETTEVEVPTISVDPAGDDDEEAEPAE